MTLPDFWNHDGRTMHIPLSRDEIAAFLEVAPVQVDQLWHRGFLQRSLHCAHRPVAALSHSSIYDVLEYALAAGLLRVRLSKEVAALWVAQLAEADEWEAFAGEQITKKLKMMMDMAIEDGLSEMTNDLSRVALEILLTQTSLFDLCSDRKEAV